MKTSTVEKNGVADGVVETVSLLMARIPWPERRLAMAEVTQHLLDGKPRVAEYVFGWGRETVKSGLEELRKGVTHVNDLSKRRKPKTEEKYPQLVEDIRILGTAQPGRTSFAHGFGIHQHNGGGRAQCPAEKGVAGRDAPESAHHIEHPQPDGLPIAACGENEGSKKPR